MNNACVQTNEGKEEDFVEKEERGIQTKYKETKETQTNVKDFKELNSLENINIKNLEVFLEKAYKLVNSALSSRAFENFESKLFN
jgi:hypothetical protein